MESLGIYIHIPFCERKCYYCDFTSFPKFDINIEKYANNVIKELAMYKKTLSNYKIDTIFIGGGTPSSIDSKYIKDILTYIYKNFNSQEIKEVTMEVNPGTLNIENAKIYKEIGINRISLGLQTLNDNLLKSIGRIHTAREFYDSLEILRNLGFNNINVDLMFGLPQQTINDLNDTINRVMDLEIEHISLYGLIIEEGTLINNWYQKGLLELPNEDTERLMYHSAIKLLKSKGYNQYEISNFSMSKKECQHNLTYWKLKPYLGVGASSHSNLFNKRFSNFSNLNDYNNSLDNNIIPIEGEEIISKNMEIAEYCILGLRLIEGINKSDFTKRFGMDINCKYKGILNKHKENGLISIDGEFIKLTKKGLDLANLVEVDLLP